MIVRSMRAMVANPASWPLYPRLLVARVLDNGVEEKGMILYLPGWENRVVIVNDYESLTLEQITTNPDTIVLKYADTKTLVLAGWRTV